MLQSNLTLAREILAQPRIALVGLSRNEKDFSRMLFRELVRRGREVVPVNPALDHAEGRRCFPRVSAVDEPVDAAIVLVAPAQAEAVVQDCLAAGVRRIWFHRGAGRGSASAAALSLCAASGVEPVTDLCPMMALPDAGFPHRLHGFVRRLGHHGARA